MKVHERSAAAPVDLMLVCSSGGHLLQLMAMQDVWSGRARIWISNDRSDARSLLRDEPAVFVRGPSSRSARAFLRNLSVAVRLVARHRPKVLLTTGADIAVPFAWTVRIAGGRVVYVESFTRIETPSLTCRLIAPVADRVYAQWPDLVHALPNARFVGAVVESS